MIREIPPVRRYNSSRRDLNADFCGFHEAILAKKAETRAVASVPVVPMTNKAHSLQVVVLPSVGRNDPAAALAESYAAKAFAFAVAFHDDFVTVLEKPSGLAA